VGEVPLQWRLKLLLGQAQAGAGQGDEARRSIAEAADILRPMAEELAGSDLGRSFGSRPEVRFALGDADASVRRT
jgi:hypothetical protein